jgi:hypothetical protein
MPRAPAVGEFRGSIAAARQTYEYVAAEMRWSTAALALAATYDPHELSYLAPLVVPDTERARHWYERARELAGARVDFHVQRLGAPDAERRAERLSAHDARAGPSLGLVRRHGGEDHRALGR